MKKFQEYKQGATQNYSEKKEVLKYGIKSSYFDFANKVEALVDKKLNRFYVTRKEHEEVKRLFMHELGLANQKIRQLEAERDASIASAIESKNVVEDLSENAKKLLQLNNELKELLKQDIENEAIGAASGSEVVINSMKNIRNNFSKKTRKKR